MILASILLALATPKEPRAPWVWTHPVYKCKYIVIEDNWGKRAAYHIDVCGSRDIKKCPSIIQLKPR